MRETTKTAFLYAFIIALGGFVFGYDASVISGTLRYVISDFDLSPSQVGRIFLTTGLAALFASFTVGILADKFGRKRTLQFLALLYIISALLSANAWSYNSLLFGRVVGGYAFGSLVIAPIFIAELAPAPLRGRLGSINQMNIVVGLSTAYFVNLLLFRFGNSDAALAQDLQLADNLWNWMFGMELLPALLWFVLLLFIPQSPRWLATQSKWDAAEKSLSKIVEPDEIDTALHDIKSLISDDLAPFSDRLNQLFSKRMRFVLSIGIIIGIIQQISGINAIFFFATTIFELTGVGEQAAFVQSVIIGLTNVVVTIIVIALIDRIGRRPLMITGLVGIVLSMGVATYGFRTASYSITNTAIETLNKIENPKTGELYINDNALLPLVGKTFSSDVEFKDEIDGRVGQNFMRDQNPAILKATMNANSMLILIGIVGFVASFALSLGPIMWVFLGEIFPVRIRGLAISFVTIFNSGTSLLITTYFPTTVAEFGISTVFTFFFIWSIIGLVLISWLMPETKGMTLEEIEQTYVTP